MISSSLNLGSHSTNLMPDMSAASQNLLNLSSETPLEKPRPVSINDLFDLPARQMPQSSSVESKKRKSDDISEANESTSVSAANEQDFVGASSTSTTTQPILAPSSTPEESAVRAPKRMKRFFEAVGYAALGGAAVGAGLFSVLVVTAPVL